MVGKEKPTIIVCGKGFMISLHGTKDPEQWFKKQRKLKEATLCPESGIVENFGDAQALLDLMTEEKE